MNLVVLISIIIGISVLPFKLTHTRNLPDFPSGSSIVMVKDKLYVIGDDANSVLVLNKDYVEIDRINLFDLSQKRISKEDKIDLEAAVLMSRKKGLIMAFGSGSEEAREKSISFSTRSKKKKGVIATSKFLDRLAEHGIEEVNIEGAAIIGKQMFLVNRGNIASRRNHIIITTTDFYENQDECPIKVQELTLSSKQDDFLGVSEIHYLAGKDLLFFTFTTELTDNSYEDGTIGESYLGWIRSASLSPVDSIAEITSLSAIHPDFRNQKIEGICAEQIGGAGVALHLVADNDQGETKLFKVEVTLD